MLILLLMARQASTAQTVEAPSVTVTGEAVATPTPHDNWHAMRQHIMPEVTKNLRLIAGITNLTDEKYYDRLFANGIEPAPRRCGYAGVSLSF